MIAFYDEMTALVHERIAEDVVYAIFNKAFSAVCCNILIDELMKYRWHK